MKNNKTENIIIEKANHKNIKKTWLALDVATHVGYALYDGERITEHGTWQLSDNKEGQRESELRKELSSYIKEKGVRLVIVEDIYYDQYKQTAFKVLQSLQAIVSLVCYDNGLPAPIKYLPTKWKSKLFGYRNRYADKNHTMNCVQKHGYVLGELHPFKVDDEADAICIMYAHCAFKNKSIANPSTSVRLA